MTEVNTLLQERHKTHGKYVDFAGLVQGLKNELHNTNGWERLSNIQKESVEMVLHKIGRIVTGNPSVEDHWVDMMGYTQLALNELRDIEV